MGENRQIYSRLKKLLNKNFIKIKKKRRRRKKKIPPRTTYSFTRQKLSPFVETNIHRSACRRAYFSKKKRKKERTDGLFTMADRWSKSARDDSRYRFEGNDAARSRIPVQLTRPAALSKRKYRRPLKIYHRGPFFPPSRL